MRIEADGDRLRQALVELVGKAIKLTHAGGITVSDGMDIHNRAAALARLEDDEMLLEGPIGMSIHDAPQHLRELEAGWQHADWARLGRVAHTFQGLLATFSSGPAHAAAALEQAASKANT